jgi:hypothetical protein
MDIFRLWDIGAGRDGVDVYEGIDGILRGRLTIAGIRPWLNWMDPLIVDTSSLFVYVQGRLVVWAELEYEAVDIVSRGRDDIRVTSLVNDPTPRVRGRDRCKASREILGPPVVQHCSPYEFVPWAASVHLV